LNQSFGNVGSTVTLHEPARVNLPNQEDSIEDLVESMNANEVDTLFVLDADPVRDAPADLDFARAFAHVATTVTLASHEHETAKKSQWFLPLAHYLESWGDGRALDGTLSFVQPLVAPLRGGRSIAAVLSILAGDTRTSYDLLRAYWRARLPLDHDFFWERALQRGVVEGSASPPVTPQLSWNRALPPEPEKTFEIWFPASPQLDDGRFAGNAWLYELPHPTTKLTWDNALMLSPATAKQLGVETGDDVELARGRRKLAAPVMIVPGHADGCGTLELGWGRDGHGVDAYRLRAAGPFLAAIRPLATRRELAVTQEHVHAGERQLVAVRDLAQAGEPMAWKGPLPSLMADRNGDGHQWAMSIDTSVCTGCNACMVACQAENNVPVVGKAQVLRSREMHWLRIDRYLSDDDEVVNLPMLCQHCEKAPCEYVCPVNATVHSADGLSEMVYNRCIGTRTCSNNCPYKVRRFNWLDFVDGSLVRLQKNPNVTVRERGVMEKCSFCVQRIRAVEIQARVDKKPMAPDEVKTACQQACPTQAIRFGSLADKDSEMMRLRAEPRAYEALHDLGTVPRVLYLAKVQNPKEEA
jgi:molybdopterin-containing oxidoreductase family iron-sulfur binding subunit